MANPAAYACTKALAAERAGQSVGGRTVTSPHDPVPNPSFEGQFESDLAPPDTTGDGASESPPAEAEAVEATTESGGGSNG